MSKLVPAFFISFFVLGVFIFQDYGISWDEPFSRLSGITSYVYIRGEGKELLTSVTRDYGTAFEVLLIVVERWLNFDSQQSVFFLRHFLTFIFFFTSTICFYFLVKLSFKSKKIALLGTTFLIVSPRIFADSFYNSKDIPLLSVMIMAVLSLTYFLNNPTWKRAITHAAVCAFAVDIRLLGLTIVGLTIGFLLLDTFIVSKRTVWRSRLGMLFLFAVSFVLFTIAFWPYLWTDPIGHFFESLAKMAHFTRGPSVVFYLGERVSSSPWHYIPVWILVTTPLVYIALFLVGIRGIVRACWRISRSAYQENRNDFIFLTWFVAPLITVITLGSYLFDGWRHIYFIYPALILIALRGLKSLWQRTQYPLRLYLRGAVASIIVVNLACVIFFMIRYHPYQNLYFNLLAGRMENAKATFELDYWGLAFREGLEYIAGHDPNSQITVFFDEGHKDNPYILPDNDRRRFISVEDESEAKYILSNYRLRSEYPQTTEFYSVKVRDTKIMTVFKRELR